VGVGELLAAGQEENVGVAVCVVGANVLVHIHDSMSIAPQTGCLALSDGRTATITQWE